MAQRLAARNKGDDMRKFVEQQLTKFLKFLPRANLKLRDLLVFLRRLERTLIIGLSIVYMLCNGWFTPRNGWQPIDPVPEKGGIETQSN
jgi:hypothetical protein